MPFMRCCLLFPFLVFASCNGGDSSASSRIVFCTDVPGITEAQADEIVVEAEEAAIEVEDARTDSVKDAVNVVTCGGTLISSEANAEGTPAGTVARIRSGDVVRVELR